MVEEATRDVGCGEFAVRPGGKDAFTPAREGVVERVAPRAGDEREDGEEGPGEAEAARDAERRSGADVEGLRIEEDEGVGEGCGGVVFGEEARGRGRVEGGEAEAGVGISTDDESDGGGAEGAIAVEEDDGM